MGAFLWFYLAYQDEFSYNYGISNYTTVTFSHTSTLPLIQKFLFAKNPSIVRYKLAIQASDNALSTYFLAESPMWHTDT
jgi:hypothetical protein